VINFIEELLSGARAAGAFQQVGSAVFFPALLLRFYKGRRKIPGSVPEQQFFKPGIVEARCGTAQLFRCQSAQLIKLTAIIVADKPAVQIFIDIGSGFAGR